MRTIILGLLVLIALSACDTSEPVDTRPIPEPVTAPATCGDAEVQQPNDDGVLEACDDGDRNGEPCDAPYGGSCLYCTDTCEQERSEGGYCGNGVCEDYEDYDLCPADCERVFEAPTGEDGLLYYLPEAQLEGEGLISDEQVDISETFTIAAWVLWNEKANAYIVSRGDDGPMPRGGYSLSIGTSGMLRYETHKISESTSNLNDVPVGEWTHVAITFERTRVPQLIYYVNGEQVRVENGLTPPRPLETGLLVGRRGPSPTYGFVGTIRDLRIYDRTLEGADIELLVQP